MFAFAYWTWLDRERTLLARTEPALTGQIFEFHETMHAAVRSICFSVLSRGAAAAGDLERYEHCQSQLVARLGELRDRIAASMAHRDSLTGLPLRHNLARTFELRQCDARSGAVSLHLAMIDIDRFKAINDGSGHLVGDAALTFVAAQLRATLRASDVLIRYGGKEFLALLLSSYPEGAVAAVDRLCDAVRASPLQIGEREIAISIGLTQVGEGEALRSAIDRADQALLEGKRAGRNHVAVSVVHPVK